MKPKSVFWKWSLTSAGLHMGVCVALLCAELFFVNRNGEGMCFVHPWANKTMNLIMSPAGEVIQFFDGFLDLSMAHYFMLLLVALCIQSFVLGTLIGSTFILVRKMLRRKTSAS